MNNLGKALFLWSIVWMSCLEAGPPPLGTRIVEGRDIQNFQFINLGEETVVRFDRHMDFAKGSLGARFDTYVVSLDGSNLRKVIVNRTDHGPQLMSFPAGSTRSQHFLVDETIGANKVAVSTLIRLSPLLEEQLRIEGITRYMPGSAPGFPDLILYEKPVQGRSFQDLHLWNGVESVRLGVDSGSGQMVFGGSGAIYAIMGEARVLSRLKTPDDAMLGLREQVSRFQLSPDEAYAAVSVTEDGKTKDLILELSTKREMPFVRSTSGMWAGFQGSYFIYIISKSTTAPGEVHAIDLTSGKENVTLIPEPLVDIVARLPRPNSTETLVMDSQGHAVFVSSIDGTLIRTVSGKLYAPKFTKDGADLLYIDPQAPTLVDSQIHGPLLQQSADLDKPARLFSPPGTSTRAGFFDFTSGDRGDFLYFWVHYGRGNWDLYFAFFDTGELRLITRSILQVSVGEHNIFGILNASQQDQTGDLVNRDLDTGMEIMYSHAVAEMVVGGENTDSPEPKVAYLVRGRAPSSHDGIWLAPILRPSAPDGGITP